MIKNRKLVFIVGSARSGTTWLQQTLAQSPNVSTGPETHLFNRYLISAMRNWRELAGANIGISSLVQEPEYYHWLAGLSNLCFQRIAERKTSSRVILEKTPAHGRVGPEILQLYPQAYFLHIVRDPRAVVTSLLAASGSWGSTWAPRALWDACSSWSQRLKETRTISTLTPRYYEIFYERLHANGPAELVKLFEWLEEPIELEEAEHCLSATDINKLRSAALQRLPDKRETLNAFYRRGEVDSWRRELSGSDIAIIERLTRKQMAELGYEPVARRRDRLIAEAKLQSYRLANKLAKAMHAGAERIKP